jgi:thiol:disulfide interchange protein DsbC
MHKFSIRVWAAVTTTTLSSAIAMASDGDDAAAAALRQALRQQLPGLPAIDAVVRSPVEGLWEVRVGAIVFYADSSGRYTLQGELRDLQTQRNLTKDRVEESAAINYADLPVRDALTTRRGNGQRSVAVFADAECGYCKALEKEMVKLDDVTVHVFPVAMLGPDSRRMGNRILCAKSPERAWQNWMVKGLKPPTASCDKSALARNEAYAKRHLLRVTPTIVFADGSRHEGMISAKLLSERLAAVAHSHAD